MSVVYNENDPAAVAVLHQQSMDGSIAPGHVDSRSIKELQPHDVADAAQVHLFAGGGLWSVAARLAGWPDARPLWTVSCPCQPFSQAGQGRGVDDPRHLWPDVSRLLRGVGDLGRLPPVIVGEQVAGAAGYAWFNGVRADLEAQGYRVRVVDIPACAVDAPHIRQRLYWVAFADTDRGGCAGRPESAIGRAGERAAAERDMSCSLQPDTDKPIRRVGNEQPSGKRSLGQQDAGATLWPGTRERSFWAGAEWITCHDGKARRAQPGIRDVVDGLPAGVDQVDLARAVDYSLLVPPFKGRIPAWKIAGNAIVPQLAAEVIGALMDILDDYEATP